jgi:hypothetical protein
MFAQALIEHPVTGERYAVGDEVPNDLPSLEELIAQKVVSDESPIIKIGSGDEGYSKEKQT